MPGRLARTVIVRTADGSAVAFGPNDDVPGWAAEQITNPEAWESESVDDADGGAYDPSMEPTSELEPPAKSALKDEWVDYAVTQGMTRSEAETWTKERLIENFSRGD